MTQSATRSTKPLEKSDPEKARWVNEVNEKSTTFHISTEFFSKATNFTYALHLGGSIKATDNFHVDLTYSWKDFGATKRPGNLSKFSELKNTTLLGKKTVQHKGHHITLGLRYDI